MMRTMVVGVMVAMTALVACSKDSGGSAGAGGDSIGIKECDDYIKKWDSCYKDPVSRAAAKPAFDQMKAAWAEQAKNPATKAALATGCKMSLDSFPAAACK